MNFDADLPSLGFEGFILAGPRNTAKTPAIAGNHIVIVGSGIDPLLIARDRGVKPSDQVLSDLGIVPMARISTVGWDRALWPEEDDITAFIYGDYSLFRQRRNNKMLLTSNRSGISSYLYENAASPVATSGVLQKIFKLLPGAPLTDLTRLCQAVVGVGIMGPMLMGRVCNHPNTLLTVAQTCLDTSIEVHFFL